MSLYCIAPYSYTSLSCHISGEYYSYFCTKTGCGHLLKLARRQEGFKVNPQSMFSARIRKISDLFSTDFLFFYLFFFHFYSFKKLMKSLGNEKGSPMFVQWPGGEQC